MKRTEDLAFLVLIWAGAAALIGVAAIILTLAGFLVVSIISTGILPPPPA